MSHPDKRGRMTNDHSPTCYEQKFSDFLFLLQTIQEDVVIVHHPQVLGDTYVELIESLNRLADSGKQLAILPRHERAH